MSVPHAIWCPLQHCYDDISLPGNLLFLLSQIFYKEQISIPFWKVTNTKRKRTRHAMIIVREKALKLSKFCAKCWECHICGWSRWFCKNVGGSFVHTPTHCTWRGCNLLFLFSVVPFQLLSKDCMTISFDAVWANITLRLPSLLPHLCSIKVLQKKGWRAMVILNSEF